LALCVPESHGGFGADYATYAMVSAELGRHCGATALTFNMHVCTSLWTGLLSQDLDMTADERASHTANQQIHFARIAKEGKIYAQPFSEGGAAAAGAAAFGTLAKKVQGGYIVNGKKIFASLSDAADYFGVLCTEDKVGQKHSRRDTLYLAIDRNSKGVSVVGDWDPLGMRGTVSRTLLFKDVFVPESEALMPVGVYVQAASRWPHMFMTLAPTYMGIVQAAYDFTVQYLRGDLKETGGVKRRMYPTKQLTVAEMFVKLENIRALFLRAISDAKIDAPKSAKLRAYAAQYTIMEGAQDLARLAIRTCGGQSMLKNLPLERLYRDARCGSLMLPWTAELCMDRIGREALYEVGESDD
jgi:alkylation response protein AidB-like acyl-CoA dehydrogenase